MSDQLVAKSSDNTQQLTNRQTTILFAGFEPTISAGLRPQTHALDRTATGTGSYREQQTIFPSFIPLVLVFLGRRLYLLFLKPIF